MNTPPGAIATGQVTRRDWLQTQTEILRSINNVIAGIMLYTARKDWDYACWELSTGHKLLTDAEYAQGGLATISTYLSQIIQNMSEVDNNLNQIFEKSGLQALNGYVGITYHDLEVAIDRLKKFA